MAWTPDGKNIASAGHDGTIRVWNARKYLRQQMVTAVVFSPDGSKIAAANEYGHGDEFQIFDAKTQAKLGSALRHSGGVVCIAWNNDGTKLATGSQGLDSSVRIWSEVSTGTFECHSTLNVRSPARSISYSPSGDTLAVGCDNGNVLLVDAVSVVVKRSFSEHRYRQKLL